MNITEQALVAIVVLAISGTVLYLGGKAFDQIEENTAFIEQVATPNMEPAHLERLARAEAERRQRVAAEHLGQN